MKQIRSAETSNETWSDHPPEGTFDIWDGSQRSLYWKMNCLLLQDRYRVAAIKKDIIQYFQINNMESIKKGPLWDTGKTIFRHQLISIAARLKKERVKKKIELEQGD